MEEILKLIKFNSLSIIPSVLLAQISSHPYALFCCSNFASWIIDSGVTDHMTNHSHPFTNYLSCPSNEKIKNVDGSFLPITRKGLITIFESINLKFFLHFPKLICNIMYVSTLTKNYNCRVIFYNFIYIF